MRDYVTLCRFIDTVSTYRYFHREIKMTKICKLTLDVYTFPSPYRFELPQKGLT